MLSPHFLEGSQLQNAGVVEIELQEDDADWMINVCRIAHNQTDKVVLYIYNFDGFLSVSGLCDKYDLRKLMKSWAKCWMTDMIYKNYYGRYVLPSDREKLLVAAYRFRHAEMFILVGNRMITQSNEQSGKPDHNTWSPDLGINTAAILGELEAGGVIEQPAVIFADVLQMASPPNAHASETPLTTISLT